MYFSNFSLSLIFFLKQRFFFYFFIIYVYMDTYFSFTWHNCTWNTMCSVHMLLIITISMTMAVKSWWWLSRQGWVCPRIPSHPSLRSSSVILSTPWLYTPTFILVAPKVLSPGPISLLSSTWIYTAVSLMPSVVNLIGIWTLTQPEENFGVFPSQTAVLPVFSIALNSLIFYSLALVKNWKGDHSYTLYPIY